MIITYHGDNYFKIQSGSTTILLDPTNQRSLKGANLVVNTLSPPFISASLEAEPFWINHAGEYEVAGIRVRGIQNIAEASGSNSKEHTIYKVEFENINLAFLGHLTKELIPEAQEFLSDIDVVVIPGGGKPYISQASAAKLIRQLEPVIVVPSLFKNIKPFLKEFGDEQNKLEEKLVIKKKDLRSGEMKITCLKN